MATCKTCGGSGEVQCVQCYGSGKHGSDPKKPCAYCKGSGKQKCYNCYGSGRVTSVDTKEKE